jgi:hypothetical protein
MRKLLLTVPLLLAMAVPADAGKRPDQYVIPGDRVFPEGIARDGKAFFVGSTTDGTLFRGDTREREMEVLSPGGTGGRTTAIGIEALKDGRLLVAGGATGKLFVVDARTGEALGSAQAPPGATGQFFLNDIAVDGGFAYVTDSPNHRVLRWPLRGGALEVLADLPDRRPGFNANGVERTGKGELVVVQSNTGALHRVTTRGDVRRVDTGGTTFPNGDGLALAGRTLYVLRNAAELVVPVRLSKDALRGTAGRGLTDPSFKYPTTLAVEGKRLLLVNSQFDRRSAQQPPELPFDVVAVDRPR